MDTPLPTPAEMANWDRRAIQEAGIYGEILMENASREALRVLRAEGPELHGSFALFLAGSGNNGGDAFALARHVFDSGAHCLVLHTRPLEEYKGETRYHALLCQSCGVPMQLLSDFDSSGLPEPDIVVDGLLGTGFQGELRRDYREWIRWMNRMGRRSFLLALDIPSGLNGESGAPAETTVRAHSTVTFEAAKTGLFLPQAAEYTGRLHVARIGIPGWIKDQDPPSLFGLDEGVFRILAPPEPSLHKGAAGHLLIIGGSRALSGAPALAAMGALRAGAGLVTVACPEEISGEIKQGNPEIMSLPLPSDRAWSAEAFSLLEKQLDQFDAAVLGPGMGRDRGALDFVRAYLQGTCLPTVFDADALFALAQERSLLANLSREDLLTPHPGEMARLLEKSIEQVQSDRLATARGALQEASCGIVLKGPGSVVVHPDTASYVSPFACPNLAVGGSGDVLSGVLGSLLSRGVPTLSAACLGVYWHGKAGEALGRKYARRGNLAREIAEELPFCTNSANQAVLS